MALTPFLCFSNPLRHNSTLRGFWGVEIRFLGCSNSSQGIRGLLVFNMNFASKGLFWAGNIYQKLEKVCTENDLVQDPCKYVDAVSDHIKQMFDELTNGYVKPSDGCVEESVSSLKHANVVGDCKKPTVESIVSSTESLSHQDLCDELKSISTEAVGSTLSDGTGHTTLEPDVSSSGDLSLVTCSPKSISTEVSRSELSDGTEEDSDMVESMNSSRGDWNLDDLTLLLSQQSTYDEHDINLIATKVLGSKYSDEAGECKNAEPIDSSMGDPSLITSPDAVQEPNQKNTCDEHGFKLLSVEATTLNMPVTIGEKSKDISNPIVDVANVKSSFPLSYKFTSSESHQNKLIEEGSTSLDRTSSLTGTYEHCVSQETMSLLGSLKDEHGQQDEHDKLDASDCLTEMEISDDSCMEHDLDTIDMVHPRTRLMESFEDVNLEACWHDAENFELVIIPNHVCNKAPEKKKFKDAIISKVVAAKRNKRTKNQHHNTNIEMPNSQGTNASSISEQCKISSPEDICGSDWVLL